MGLNLHPLKDISTGKHHSSVEQIPDDGLRANIKADSELVRLQKYFASQMKEKDTSDVDRILDLKNAWKSELNKRT